MNTRRLTPQERERFIGVIQQRRDHIHWLLERMDRKKWDDRDPTHRFMSAAIHSLEATINFIRTLPPDVEPEPPKPNKWKIEPDDRPLPPRAPAEEFPWVGKRKGRKRRHR